MVDISNISIDIEAKIGNAISKIEKVEDKLEDLSIAEATHGKVNVDVDVDGSDEIALLHAQLASLPEKVTTKINVDRDGRVGSVTRKVAEGVGRVGRKAVSTPSSGGGGDSDDFDGGTLWKIRNAMGSMENMSDTLEGLSENEFLDAFNVRMSSLYDILAKLIPLIAIFVGALPALIGAIGTLAAAALSAAVVLGGIGALALAGLSSQRSGGGMPSMEELGKLFEDVLEDLWEAFSPIAEQLAPVAENAVDELKFLFQDLANVISPIVDAMDDDFDAIGTFLTTFAVELTKALGLLATSFDEIFAEIGQSINEGLVDAIIGIIKYTKEVYPALALFGQIFLDLLPVIMELSVGFLKIANFIGVLVNTFSQFASVLQIPADIIGVLIGLILLFVSTIGMLIISIGLASGAAMNLVNIHQMLAASSWIASGAIGSTITALQSLAVTLIFIIGILSLLAVAAVLFSGLFDQLTNSVSSGGISDDPRSGPSGGGGGGDTYVQNDVDYIHNIDSGGRDARETESYRTHKTDLERRKSSGSSDDSFRGASF